MFFERYTRKIALHNYKKRHVCKNVDNIVVNEFRHKKIFDSIKLFEITICLKILFYNIVLLFRLLIDLKIKSDEKIFDDF